jgi:hypothetical protein
MIERRVEKGALIPEYPGVYRVGHAAPSVEATYMAAVLACGDDAVLIGRPAAWLWNLIKGMPPPPEVSAPTERRVNGLPTRRRRLAPSETTTHRRIPVTTVPLTLLDLTPLLPQSGLARACHEAGVRYGTTPAMVEDILRLRPNLPGAANLRRVLRGEEPVTLSALEAKFLERLRAAALPLPVTNRPAGGRRVDCRWPKHGLTVEIDSYRFHSSRHAWENDRRREREAYARGDEFRRFTYGDVFERPRSMMRELRQLLPADPRGISPGARGGPRRARGRG